jgi:hypothetical protein
LSTVEKLLYSAPLDVFGAFTFHAILRFLSTSFLSDNPRYMLNPSYVTLHRQKPGLAVLLFLGCHGFRSRASTRRLSCILGSSCSWYTCLFLFPDLLYLDSPGLRLPRTRVMPSPLFGTERMYSFVRLMA